MWRATARLATAVIAGLAIAPVAACTGGHHRAPDAAALAATAVLDAAALDAAPLDAVPLAAAPRDAAPLDLVPELDGGVAGDSIDPRALAAATSMGGETLTLAPVGFDALPDWADDHHAEAVPSFLASCGRLAGLGDDDPISVAPYGGRARAWRHACAAAAEVPAHDDAAARAFFETEFAAYEADGKRGPLGKMTGYYVESLRGSRTRHDAYQFPI